MIYFEKIIWLVLFLGILFLSVRLDVSPILLYLKVPTPIYYAFFFAILMILFLKNFKNFYVKSPFNILILLCLYQCILAIIHPFSLNSFHTFLIPFVSLMVYGAITYTKVNKEFLLKIVEIFYYSFVIQTIIATLYAQLTIDIYQFVKSSIVIPYGASNYISATILILMIFLMHNSKRKNIIFCLGILSIIFTRSDIGIGLVLFYSVCYIFFNHNIKLIQKIGICCVVSSVFILVSCRYPEIIMVWRENLGHLFSGNIAYVFNGRLSLYDKSFLVINQNLILGVGFNYPSYLNNFLSHNIFLDLLLQGGIIYLLICIIFFASVIKIKTNRRVIRNLLFFSLVNSIFEPSLWTFQYNILLFFIIGFLQRKD